jgi:hypothetical protein
LEVVPAVPLGIPAVEEPDVDDGAVGVGDAAAPAGLGVVFTPDVSVGPAVDWPDVPAPGFVGAFAG